LKAPGWSSGFSYYEERGNCTPLQFNHTEPAAGLSAAASPHATTANCASRPTPAESDDALEARAWNPSNAAAHGAPVELLATPEASFFVSAS